jgi:hypothetical protein
MMSFLPSFPLQNLLDFEKKKAISILFLYQFLCDMYQSTGKNTSLWFLLELVSALTIEEKGKVYAINNKKVNIFR